MPSGSGTPTGAMPSGAAPSGGAGGADGGQNISDFGASVVNASHLSTLKVDPWTADVDSIIYGNSSCILNPEGEIGPYCTETRLPFDQSYSCADKDFQTSKASSSATISLRPSRVFPSTLRNNSST